MSLDKEQEIKTRCIEVAAKFSNNQQELIDLTILLSKFVFLPYDDFKSYLKKASESQL